MKCATVEQAIAEWRRYRKTDNLTPFFIAVDSSDEYRQLREIVLEETGITISNVSDRCDADAFPDYDGLVEWLRNSAFDDVVLFGLGESLALIDDASFLSRLKDESFPHGLLVICRGVRRTLEELCGCDSKFAERRICFLRHAPFPRIVQYEKSLPVTAAVGTRELLSRMEIGQDDEYSVKSDVTLRGVERVMTPYDVCKRKFPGLTLREEVLTNEQWQEMIRDPDLEKAYRPSHWRTFAACKTSVHQNPYLRFVASTTHTSTAWETAIVQGLLNVAVSDKDFDILYNSRKGVVGSVDSALLNEYVAKTAICGDERYAYLTDGSSVERQAIIRSLHGRGSIPERVKNNYPILSKYLCDYQFSCPYGELLTKYFSVYKVQKILNRIDPDFIEQVEALAGDGQRVYNALPTRGEFIDKCKDKGTELVWIDGLGVEYLGLIQCLAKEHQLSISVHISRANLPTLTSLNSDFYESWPGLKMATKELDNIKHGNNGSINYDNLKTPDHLALELDVISDWMKRCSDELHLHKCRRVLIVSDHGASRLAVIRESESSWEMKEKGQHSGRCCPKCEIDEKPSCATEENGYWVLANYDRFKGGRRSFVEVHGGATLEEVVVPVIELTLQNDAKEVLVKDPVTKVGLKCVAMIDLFCADKMENVTVELGGKRYSATPNGEMLYHVEFPDLRRAGQYTVKVFEGDNYIQDVTFTAESAAGKMNKMDDFFK